MNLEPSMGVLGRSATRAAGAMLGLQRLRGCKPCALAAFCATSKLRIGQGLRTERFDPDSLKALRLSHTPQFLNRLPLAQFDCQFEGIHYS